MKGENQCQTVDQNRREQRWDQKEKDQEMKKRIQFWQSDDQDQDLHDIE